MSSTMKALFKITLFNPKDYTQEQKASAAVMQYRLNANFTSIFEKLFEHDNDISDMPAEILAQIPLPSDYVTSDGLSGAWRYRKWFNGVVEAWTDITGISKTISTANGALYSAEYEVTLPTSMFGYVDSVNVTAESVSPIFASIKSITTSKITVLLSAATSALFSLAINIRVTGRA